MAILCPGRRGGITNMSLIETLSLLTFLKIASAKNVRCGELFETNISYSTCGNQNIIVKAFTQKYLENTMHLNSQ